MDAPARPRHALARSGHPPTSMSVDPLDPAFHQVLIEHLGPMNADAVLTAAEEATRCGWAPEWFAEVTHAGRKHVLRLTALADNTERWMIKVTTEEARPDGMTTTWACGRRDRQQKDSTVIINENDRVCLQKLIGKADTNLLLRSAQTAAQGGWAQKWFANVTHTTQRHAFKLHAFMDGLRRWRLACHTEELRDVHAGLSWACGRQKPRTLYAHDAHSGATHAKGSEVCHICTERFPDLTSSARMHRCWVCRLEYEIQSGAGRSNHRQRPHVALACDLCREAGYSAYDIQTYECQICKRSFGHRNYRPADVRNYRRRKVGALKCHACRHGHHTYANSHTAVDRAQQSRDQPKKHRSLQEPRWGKHSVATDQSPNPTKDCTRKLSRCHKRRRT